MNRIRGWLGRFALVGIVATLVDAGVLTVGAGILHGSVLPVNLLAVTLAAVISYAANRLVTFRNDPFVRWVHQPSAFLAVAITAGGADTAVLGGMLYFGNPLAVAKVAAISIAALVRIVAYRWLLFQGLRRRQGEREAGRAAPQGEVRLSVVVPAYREEERIGTTIEALLEALSEVGSNGGLEIVVVDDGSPDATADAAEAVAQIVNARGSGSTVKVLSQERNRGKGAAVRAGVLVATGRAIAFTDADLAYAPHQLLALLAQVEDGWDMVVGSRHHAGTTTLVRAGWVREFGSRVINLFTLALLLGQYRDTQCGLKAFRSDPAKLLFRRSRIDGFAFDVELFHLAERYELSLMEVAVKVENSERSTVKVVRDAGRLLRDLLRIRRWAKQGCYDAETSP